MSMWAGGARLLSLLLNGSSKMDFGKGLVGVNNHPKVTPIYQLKFPPLG